MYLAMLRLEVRINDGPRAKRRTVQAILDKLHRNFNVSVFSRRTLIGHSRQTSLKEVSLSILTVRPSLAWTIARYIGRSSSPRFVS